MNFRFKIMQLKFLFAVFVLLPVLVFAQDNAKKTAYFFYLDSCPHCHNVNDYFNANGLYDKYDIRKLDASVPQNGEFLMKLYEANGYPEEQRGGVPVVAFGNKLFVGDKPIIDNFVKEIDATEDAQVPNVPADIVVHEGPIAEVNQAASVPQSGTTASQSKKNYFPVVIGALVVITAGALVFVNRK